jgi:hypothetical protein
MSRCLRGFVVAAIVAATAVLITPSAAQAAPVERAVNCGPGPSGNACVRLYTDAGEIWTVGATDPNPGHRIRLSWVALYVDPGFDGYYTLVGSRAGVDSAAYQRIASPHGTLVCPRSYWGQMRYVVDGSRTYDRAVRWDIISC